MDLVGTVLDVATPPAPPQLHAKILPKVSGLDSHASKPYVDEDVTDETEAQENTYEVQIGVWNCFGRAVRLESTASSISVCAANCFANFCTMPPDLLTCDTGGQTSMIHRNGEIQMHTVTREQVGNLNANDFDLFVDIAS